MNISKRVSKPLFFLRYLLTGFLLVGGAAIAQDLYVYPAQGQSDEQLGSDRYECHSWAAQESGFNPIDFGEEPPSTVRVPTIANEAEGATQTGAIVGAAIGSQDADAGKGAVVGAIIGSLIGGVAEEQGRHEAEQQAAAEVARQSEEINRTKAEKALRQSNYRRALTACLEGRGYSVR